MSDTMRRTAAIGVVVGLLAWAGAAWAVPSSLQHQGRLLKKDGSPMTGQVTLKFTLYDAKTGGSIIWQSAAKQVDLGSSGFYSVTLGGPQNAINSNKLGGGRLWVGLKVNGNQELSPRLPIRSVPYAIRAGQAESVADGAVGTDGLQNGAVQGQKISSVDWSKVQNKPQGLDDGDDDTLSGLQCTANQVAEYDGSQWTCGSAGQSYSAGAGLNLSGTTFSVQNMSCSGSRVATGIQGGTLQCTSAGDITAVNAGQGLSGGGSSGSVTLSADYTAVQQRVTGSCSGGNVMTGVNQDGTVNCEPPGESGNPTSASGCGGTFIPLETCPVGDDLSAPDCDEVSNGGICEYDYCTSGSLDGTLDNCGAGDFYMKSG